MNAKGTGLPHADGKDVPRDGERRCDGLLWAGGPALCGSGLNGNAFGGQCAWGVVACCGVDAGSSPSCCSASSRLGLLGVRLRS